MTFDHFVINFANWLCKFAMYFALINLFLSKEIKLCTLRVFLVNLFLYILYFAKHRI